jgi:hypothetical protein
VGIVVLGAGLLGAALLVVAEFTPLLHVHSSARGAGVIKTISTGAHHSYALLPLAALVVFLALAGRASGSRLVLVAIGILGLVTLAIALIGDLPDAQASGVIVSGGRSVASGGALVSAASTPSAGLYLETLGAVVLMLASGGGLLLTADGSAPAGRLFGPRRSAS